MDYFQGDEQMPLDFNMLPMDQMIAYDQNANDMQFDFDTLLPLGSMSNACQGEGDYQTSIELQPHHGLSSPLFFAYSASDQNLLEPCDVFKDLPGLQSCSDSQGYVHYPSFDDESHPLSSANLPQEQKWMTFPEIMPPAGRNAMPSPVSEQPFMSIVTEIAAHVSAKSKPLRREKRLPCPHPGCESRFPRRYELQRHENTVHNHTIRLFCPIYGCHRVDKPYPRLDKFREHYGKHKNPAKFLCIMESCSGGPFNRAELPDHLMKEHLYDYFDQPNLEIYIKLLGFLGKVNTSYHTTYKRVFDIFAIAEQRIQGKATCPYQKVLGCNFQLSLAQQRMHEHTAEDWLKVWPELKAFYYWEAFWPSLPLSYKCNLCPGDVPHYGETTIMAHVMIDHTDEERQHFLSASDDQTATF